MQQPAAVGNGTQLLAQCLMQTLAPEQEPRRRAEAYLTDASKRPGYGLLLLSLLTQPAVEEQVKQAAAVNLKNYVKYRWSPSESDVERLGDLVPVQVNTMSML